MFGTHLIDLMSYIHACTNVQATSYNISRASSWRKDLLLSKIQLCC
jgi:hypothetical protein